ncbi:uncharacterized protein N7518_000480 [Penicillium psychrosexuale]|uniref:uncharacterized protein n=1 Tax=Penicillium psychrosexuale TaxID=1002107 RepID=UPI00254520AE|nr:uncharacterized protein N7518_000480 [Penicillium psychrosexuale]KAJ5804177.1 hypothetical protein N7518_000480 [Penicillium psychrosexuale]
MTPLSTVHRQKPEEEQLLSESSEKQAASVGVQPPHSQFGNKQFCRLVNVPYKDIKLEHDCGDTIVVKRIFEPDDAGDLVVKSHLTRLISFVRVGLAMRHGAHEPHNGVVQVLI